MMQVEKQNRILEEAIKNSFTKQYTPLVEDIVMKKISERESKKIQVCPDKYIYIMLLILCISVECYMIFSPQVFLSIVHLETDFSIVLLIQSVGVLAVILQIDAICKTRKQGRFSLNTNLNIS